MSLTKDKFNKGVVVVKENYNLKTYPQTVIFAWYAILESKLSDIEYERCISILIETVPNWYQAGESLASRVLAVLPQAREKLRSERSRLEATTKPKELVMSDKERRENVERGGKMLRRLTEKLSEPRRSGESKAERRERVHTELEAEFEEVDHDNP